MGELAQPGDDFYGGKVMNFAGGVPLKRDGKVVGAVGLSGGTDKQDQSVAEAGEGSLLISGRWSA